MTWARVADLLWVAVVVVGIAVSVFFVLARSGKFAASQQFRKTLLVAMGGGVVIVLLVAAVTSLSPGPCVYRVSSPPEKPLSFVPQLDSIEYSAPQGCERVDPQVVRTGELEGESIRIVSWDQRELAGRVYFTLKYRVGANYSDGPRRFAIRWENVPAMPPVVTLTQSTAIANLRGQRRAAVKLALELYDRRIPYRYAGKTPEQGFDTSGYVAYVLSTAGLDVNPQTDNVARLRILFPEVPRPELRAGDLLFEENIASWFVLDEGYAIGVTPGTGIGFGEPDNFSSPIVDNGRVPYRED